MARLSARAGDDCTNSGSRMSRRCRATSRAGSRPIPATRTGARAGRLGRDSRRRRCPRMPSSCPGAASRGRSPPPPPDTTPCCPRIRRCTSTIARESSPAEPPGRGRCSRSRTFIASIRCPVRSPLDPRHVLGLQANLWTEHVRTEERAAYMTFRAPRRSPRSPGRPPRAWTGRISARACRRSSQRYRALGDAVLRATSSPSARSSAPQRAPHEPGPQRPAPTSWCCRSRTMRRWQRAAGGVSHRHHEPVLDLPGRRPDRPARSLTAAVGQVPFNFQLGQGPAPAIRLEPPVSGAGELRCTSMAAAGAPLVTLPLSTARRTATP